MVELEPNDLKMNASLGLVCNGCFSDLAQLRNDIRDGKFPNIRLVFHQLTNEHLYIVKRSHMTPEQLKGIEAKKGGE